MKYWIFQNNQVLGPYEPDEMGKISVFSPESLVCPEGRRGTSMGDWQRAGMVPDLSVALVRASSAGGRTATLSIAGLPPEPTLKDLAQLGSIQEKVAMLEEVVLQLQEGLRAKDAELSSVHQQLAGKSLEASEIRMEAENRQREADTLRRQIAGLEERLGSLRDISETLGKAVAEEKKVEQDVEKQGQTLFDLTREVEALRRRLEGAESRPAPTAAPAPEAFKPPEASPFAPPSMPPAAAAPAPFGDVAAPGVPPGALTPPPLPVSAPAPLPAPEPRLPDLSAPAEFPTVNVAPLPSLDSLAPPPPLPLPKEEPPVPSSVPMPMPGEPAAFDPMPFGGPEGGSLAPDPLAAPLPDVGGDMLAPEPVVPAPAKGKKALVLGAVLGLAALGGLAVVGGYVPGLQKPKAPAAVVDPAPLPPPEPAELTPAPDPRQLAVDLAKAWKLPGDRTLERALEELAPSSGNLSPWMAETLAGNRVQVNYFARSSAPGAPTIAYEFEVDLDGKTLVGRNAAAKSVLSGKAVAPPAPPKPKPVKVKPKGAAKPAPKPVEDATLDSMLGEEPPKPAAKAAPAAKPSENLPLPGHAEEGATLTDTGDAPLDEALAPPAEEKPQPRANPAKRATKAKGAKPEPKEAPADETLLDDLLKE
ncbi:MAG: hypothetical protein HY923_03885 [Elusimicrobia bacterium]|nr:hypothetical protein [Elusimicrobiota bacterium]